jgi:hypothetical protein
VIVAVAALMVLLAALAADHHVQAAGAERRAHGEALLATINTDPEGEPQ